MLDIIIPPAHAAIATSGITATLGQFVPILIIMVAFYFLLIRPQQQKVKKQREMVASLKKGEQVLTNGGLIGTVSKIIDDNQILITFGGVDVPVMRQAITDLIPATEKAKATVKAASKNRSPSKTSAAKKTTSKSSKTAPAKTSKS